MARLSPFALPLLLLALTAALLLGGSPAVNGSELDSHLWRSVGQDPWAPQAVVTDIDSLAPPSAPSSAHTLTPLRSMTDAVTDAGHSGAPTSEEVPSLTPGLHHSMRPMQAAGPVFNMTRRTAAAPFSHRIQPGLSYRTRPISYTQLGSGITIRLGPGYLLMYEGAMTGAFNGSNVVENDVWASGDDGASWDLIRGRSLFGRSGAVNAVNAASFVGRRGSNNCGDPLSDILMSLGGANLVTNNATTVSYHSFDGETWNQRQGSFAPGRFFSSCDIDESGHGFVIGGHYTDTAHPQDYLLNDVWVTSALWTYNPWRRITDRAPFSAREEHLVLVANAPHLKREIVYVIGGKVTCTNSDCYDGMNSNDVWASSDAGETWAAVNARPPFGPRWGHGGWVNKDGVLIMWGGLNALNGLYGSTTTYREVWASFNGGYDWHLCPTPPNALFLRGEQGATVNANGQLIMVGGYAYAENGQPQVRYNDVWRTDFSVENTEALAQRCGGASVVIPPEGVGMRRWPGNPTVPADTLTFSPLTRRAPWSPRIQPALLLMSSAQTYINPTDGSSGTTGPNWLLLYEGSLTAGTGPQSNENDVYASVDGGKTWVLISGIARLGQQGDKYSAYPDSSFRATSGAGNCEDPRTDDVYATGGIRSYNATYSEYSSEVWHSSDAVHWRLVNGRSFAPGRYFHSCDVDNQGRIYIIGGRTQGPVATSLLNDIWTSTNKGQTWARLTTAAPFSGRYEHSVQVMHSAYYQRDLIYVSGGYIHTGTGLGTANDVWVSSDSAMSWYLLTAAAAWGSRWGHGAAITEAGVMMVLGGTSSTQQSYSDLWSSFDGGVMWHSCRLEFDSTVIRGEQAVALTADEKLIVGNGYRYMGGYRVEYSDLWVTDASLNNSAAVARMCATTLPAQGVGLRMASWPIPQFSHSSSASPSSSPAPSTAAAARAASSSASSAAMRPMSSSPLRPSSSSTAAVKPKLCPYWAMGRYQPQCECPDEATGEYPDCMCPARYGRDAYVPYDCMDLFPDPDDPDAPTGGNGAAAAASSGGGLSTATIVAIASVVTVVFLIALLAYYRWVVKPGSALGMGMGGGGAGEGGGGKDGHLSLLGTSAGPSDGLTQSAGSQPSIGLDYYLSSQPQGGHMDTATGQQMPVSSAAPGDEGGFRTL